MSDTSIETLSVAHEASDGYLPDELRQRIVLYAETHMDEEALARARGQLAGGEVLVGVELDRPEPGEDALQVSLDSGGAVEWVSLPALSRAAA